MSRLHEVKVRGMENVDLLPNQQTEYIRTYADKLEATAGDDSPRKGTRRGKTMAKTAKALGQRHFPLGPWALRSQGVTAGKADAVKRQRTIMNQAKNMRKNAPSAK